VVFRDDALLPVEERQDGRWTLPGGWADVHESPSEAVGREAREESGFETRAVKLLALYDRRKHAPPPHLFHIDTLFFRCEVTGGAPAPSLETADVAFFRHDALPDLSSSRVTPAQIARLFEHYRHPDWPTDFDEGRMVHGRDDGEHSSRGPAPGEARGLARRQSLRSHRAVGRLRGALFEMALQPAEGRPKTLDRRSGRGPHACFRSTASKPKPAPSRRPFENTPAEPSGCSTGSGVEIRRRGSEGEMARRGGGAATSWGQRTDTGMTRKEFLASAALGTAALAFGSRLAWGKEKPIKIGGQFSMTGSLAAFGVWGHRAAEAAVKKINEEGGINGRPLEYVVEDAETNVPTGIRKMRKLILQDQVDFVVGDVHSGINIACAPIAKELNTVYFGFGTAVETTAQKGNRYIFRGMTNMRIHMKALVYGAMEQIGKRWYLMAADYAWGHSVVEETKRYVLERGGTVVGEKFAPLGTPDFIPYLSGLNPDDIDVIVIGFFTRDARTIITQIHQLFGGKVRVTGNVGVIEGMTPKDLGPGGEGVWYVDQYPKLSAYVPAPLKPFDKVFRERVGIDAEGYGIKDRDIASISFCYTPWEHVHYIKHAILRSGWKSKKDNAAFIQALEGMELGASVDFPQGDKIMRAQDHQVFHDQYICRIEAGKLVVKAHVPKEQLFYPPEVDYTKEAI
jgi:branched-chain amino acid transport system substrate-binding protein